MGSGLAKIMDGQGNDSIAKRTFNSFDKDKSGYLEYLEMFAFAHEFVKQLCKHDPEAGPVRSMLQSHEGKLIVRLLKAMDEDGDGKVSFEEFKAYVFSHTTYSSLIDDLKDEETGELPESALAKRMKNLDKHLPPVNPEGAMLNTRQLVKNDKYLNDSEKFTQQMLGKKQWEVLPEGTVLVDVKGMSEGQRVEARWMTDTHSSVGEGSECTLFLPIPPNRFSDILVTVKPEGGMLKFSAWVGTKDNCDFNLNGPPAIKRIQPAITVAVQWRHNKTHEEAIVCPCGWIPPAEGAAFCMKCGTKLG
jgi:hypothetical protein